MTCTKSFQKYFFYLIFFIVNFCDYDIRLFVPVSKCAKYIIEYFQKSNFNAIKYFRLNTAYYFSL